MSQDYSLDTHKAWLGLLQPVGLVVSPVALTQAQAAVDSNCIESQLALKQLLTPTSEQRLELPSGYFERLFIEVLDWRPGDLKPLSSDSEVGNVFLKEYQETLSATHAVYESKTAEAPFMLAQLASNSVDFDSIAEGTTWRASPQSKFERILRERSISIGLLVNTLGVRLVYAPRGESSGYVTFPFSLMAEVHGRVVLGALKMLLGADRLFTVAPKERLPNLLIESRKYQNTVSSKLSEQVLGALYELLRGLQAASDRTNGALLKKVLKEDPNRVYHGLLTVLLRNVFLLYAEDRDLIPAHRIYSENYSIKGLFEKLRADEARYTDAMDYRYGAWAQLISIYRIIYEGINFPGFTLPARRGHLFDPDRFSFLEGRIEVSDDVNPPLISDGIVYRVLQSLMILESERISYRTLDVEQIGSVYETVMGFQLEVATGPSIAIKPKKAHGAPTVIDLEKLLAIKKTERAKWFKDTSDQDITGTTLAEAKTVEDLEAALDRKISRIATPTIASKGSMVLQPSDERRRSGSHYTPRSLTEPIVKKAFEPIFFKMGAEPKPEQILDLKVCDPAMGSGAFLVESTRQLSEALVRAWRIYNQTPKLPADEDELLFARRQIAQRCIYGVDKNPMAVDLAKLSLWLSTFAKDHAFTFLDHALKCGDSLAGLTLDQIAKGTWEDTCQGGLFTQKVKTAISEYIELRHDISCASEDKHYEALVLLNYEAEQRVQRLRAGGDLILSAFFLGKSEKERKSNLSQAQPTLLKLFQMDAHFEYGTVLPDGLRSFHWELEFPEVFQRRESGFDFIVGNPPFAGKNTIIASNHESYLDWLATFHPESHGNSDLVAHFFRRAFDLINLNGAFGLIATNTVSQGDTRHTGLRWICNHGGNIFRATRRLKWPGEAAVTVSVIAVTKQAEFAPRILDNVPVDYISAYLFHMGGNDNPETLASNAGKSFQGSIVLGMGFTFDDNDRTGVANSISEMDRLTKNNPRNLERIFPYIGGEEVNTSPTHAPNRFVMNFEAMTLKEAEQWPDLISIVRNKVKPIRDSQKREALRERWWHYAEKRPGLYASIRSFKKVIVCPRTSKHLAFTLCPANVVFSENLIVFALPDKAFALLQARPHEIWTRFTSSTLEDRQGYRSTDCFETFPFPTGWEQSHAIERAGKTYIEYRAHLMTQNREGMTDTYNRFHDPNEQSPHIQKLREMHSQMDTAVLDAYGWSDIQPNCEFLLDYEDDESDAPSPSKRKKPWRFRWPDAVRDEVLARLLDLNAKRAAEEALSAPKESTKMRKGK